MTADLIAMAGLAGLSALLVMLMIRIGKLDRPGPRSSHVVPTPKGGGVGVTSAFAIGTFIFALLHEAAPSQLEVLATIVLASVGLSCIAFLDDLRDWPFSVKLAAQIVAAAVVVAASMLTAPSPGWHSALVAIAAVCWIVFVTNAMNFIDGLNGLASGVTLLASLFLAVTRGPAEAILITAPALALAAGVVGFLPFNYPKARIFMGDVGSQPCGFIIGTLGVLIATRPDVPGGSLLVPLVLSGILFDVAFTLLRRAWRGSNLTEAHREHLYQLAHRSGIRGPIVTLIHWAMAIWGGACALSLGSSTSAAAIGEVVAAVTIPQCLWLSYVAARSRRALLPF